MITEIPVDIDNVVVPPEVFHSEAADSIRYLYAETNTPIPSELQAHLEKYPERLGTDWEEKVAKALVVRGDLTLVKKWTSILPPGHWRTELRNWHFKKIIGWN